MQVDLGFDAGRLETFVGRLRDDPAAGAVVVRASTAWERGLRSVATFRRKGGAHTVAMDEPAGLGGSDTAPNMVEMVLGAYGCCLTSGFVSTAARRGIPLEGVDIDVEGDLDLKPFVGVADPADVWPGYTEVRASVTLTAPAATPEQLRELFDAVVAASPVGSIIARPVNLTTELTLAAADQA